MQSLNEQRVGVEFNLPPPPVYLALQLMGHQRFTASRGVKAFIKQFFLPWDGDIP